MSLAIGCIGKIGYPTKGGADAALGRINARRQDRRSELQSYHCKHCGFFHLGRSKTKGRNALKRAEDWRPDSYRSRKARWLALLHGEGPE